jgi:hypothetical protein
MHSPYQSSNLAQPVAGSINIDVILNFSANSSIILDLSREVLDDKISFVQSIFIDNADNSSPVTMTFEGSPDGYRVRCPAGAQGWFPVTMPVGAVRIFAQCSSPVEVNCIVTNYAMPYIVWGADSAEAELTNIPFNVVPLAAGNTQLVAGVPNESVKLFRGQFEVDGPAIISLTDGAGGAVLWTANLLAQGSLNFAETENAWLKTSPGNGLFITSSAAVNLYGGMSYVQS